ncbi:CheR family methyltransferase [Variovorax sp. UMC13]|uniref:CheR family methyltransferase n=1 Tax=Variovorax sp. UMC13 TaxID=1862326 RepID=UPI0016036D58|nr:CheR family methyltransferase [Variovorax sp. UMC13]MBB1600465.1 histidine kinase [Variovorax sp. UMC13]
MNQVNPDYAEEQRADAADEVVPGRSDKTPLVGFGGAGGALAALEHVLAGLPPRSGLAYLIALHLPPDGESGLTETLARCTDLPITRVTATTPIEPDHIYVIPQNVFLAISGVELDVVAPLQEREGRMTVDVFFRTLADTRGTHAAAVVLSGGDSDGAIGIKRVKERGGLVIAQEPREAECASMPEAAIATGMVDWVVTAAQIGERLFGYFQLEPRLRLPREEGPLLADSPEPGSDEAALRQVLDFLHGRTGNDFSSYKRATVMRRVARRMQVNGVETLPAYLDCLQTLRGEPTALLQDLLISVTNFFRDPECFAALEAQIPDLFRNKGPGDALRVWVTACATGEEAYSIAILLSEYARRLDAPPSLQIFATDLAPAAIRTAREALYPSTIRADVSDERLRRFFVQEKHGYRVRRELREMVLFAVHDLLKDSPFSRLDLATCRNLLIYLNQQVQARVFDVFEFSLVTNGRLFLGASEAPEDGKTGFAVLDRAHRLYLKRPKPGRPSAMPIAANAGPLQPEVPPGIPAAPVIASHAREGLVGALHSPRPQGVRGESWGEVHLSLLEQLAPPSILIDAEHDIVHLSPSAGRYLEYGAGEPSRNLLRLVPQSLRIELRAALFKATRTGQAVETRVVRFSDDPAGGRAHFTMRVVPMREGNAELSLVLLGEPERQLPMVAMQASADEPTARQLDQELERLKYHLRDTVEQYELSTQELKASNEELQAINEELRSATEELETSREELQSINEELTTVNHELKGKVQELAHANSDMQNLMNATAIATIFLDRELRIARYTPVAVSLFNFIPGDVGRPLSDLTPRLRYPELVGDASRVLDKLTPLEREVGMADGSWFLARLLPYRTMEDRIAGVVLSFINITERKRAEEVSQWLSSVVASSMDAIISFSLQGEVLSWNNGARRVFGYAAEEMIGQPLYTLADGKGLTESIWMREQIAQALSVENLETVGRAKDGSAIHLALTASPITDPEGRVVGGTATVRDVGDAKRSQEALRRSEERLRLVIENARDYAIFSTDVQRVITSWNSGAERLLGYTEQEAMGRLSDMIFTPEDCAEGVPDREAATAMADADAADERLHVRKNGTRFWASGTLMRMDDSSGGAIGFVKILRDETAARNARAELQRSQDELRKALQAAEQARADLERADAAKDRFLAVLSHELRNPLAAVLAASQMLVDRSSHPADHNRAAALIQRQARTMKLLLDDLLDVSRLAVGRLELRKRDVPLVDVIDSALEAVETAIANAGHRLNVNLPTQPTMLHVDPLRISQVLGNLLGNAAKYTPPGGVIELDVRMDGGEVRMSVSDNGVGIPAERIEHIFELYTQGPQAPHALNDGLGVGLSLVRNIVELHGGTVEGLSGGPGKGSRFVVRLPGPIADTLPLAERSLAAPALALDILIADDNTDAAWALAHLLQRSGQRTQLAYGGAEALDSILKHPPDAAVLDLGMPDIDGVEVARRLRADAATAHIVLIALTGWSGEAARMRALAAGFDEILSKPADLQELLAVLVTATAKRGRKEQTPLGPPY